MLYKVRLGIVAAALTSLASVTALTATEPHRTPKPADQFDDRFVASRTFSILDEVLDSVAGKQKGRGESDASPHEPPGKPDDRPPGRGQKPEPPGQPPDRPSGH